jgi:hypothetical protein
LLHEAVVDIGTLRRVQDLVRALLKESLANALVDNDQGNVRQGLAFCLGIILVSKDLLELVELVLNDLLSHGVTDTVSVDEDVIWELSAIVITVSL